MTIIPAVSAISLGLVGQDKLDKRIGRNETFNRAGNAVTAVIAGVLSRIVGLTWIFYLLVVLCIATVTQVFGIQRQDIDNAVARGDESNESKESRRNNLNF